MAKFTPQNNPLSLSFKKRNDIQDPADFKVTKILVNEASSFVIPEEEVTQENIEENGLNVISIGEQEERRPYLAGKYAEYNEVTSGGINFSDFKIESIQNTDMQMVFFVVPTGSMEVIIDTPSITKYGYEYGTSWVTAGVQVVSNKGDVNSEGKVIIDSDTTFITIYTVFDQSVFNSYNCYWNIYGGWNGSSEEQYGGKTEVGRNAGYLGFRYSLTSYNCFETTQVFSDESTTGEVKWTIPISEIVWVNDPRIEFKITAIRSSYINRNYGITENYVWYNW